MSRQMRRPGARAIALIAVAAVAAIVAGCGGSSGPGVASVGNSGSGGKGASGETASGEGSGPETSGGAEGRQSAGAGGAAGGSEGEAVLAMPSGGEQKAVEFAKCMRSHGVPNFPEPENGRIQFHAGPGSGLEPGSPQFMHAQEACRKLLPHIAPSPAQQAKMQEQALKFSQCMRSHGVPKFPDPSFSEHGVHISIGPSSGIDLRSPQFQKAQRECQSVMPGPGGKLAR